MRYRTVGEVSELTGVTVRALHHYDEIGLLSPSERTAAGYRLYSDLDVLRLHAIVNWRDMGFALSDIGSMLEDETDLATALKRQRERLAERADRLDDMIDALDRAIDEHDRGTTMTDATMLEIFDGFDPAEHEEEAAERWGDTDAHAEAARRTASYTAADWARYKRENDENLDRFVELMEAGADPASPDAGEAARVHGELIDRWFYPITPQMHLGHAEMYVSDPRFEATYERRSTGLARYVRDAIVALYD